MIIGFAGKIGSGKTTQMRFLHGFFMKHLIPSPSLRGALTDKYQMTHDGKLLIHAEFDDGEGMGEIDVRSRDPEMIGFLANVVWPYIKGYSVADSLKEIATEMFQIPKENIYGTQSQKLQETHLLWENMIGSNKTGKMTGRDFLQYFGTEVCRKLFPDVWIASTISQIKRESPQYAIIDDIRFDNEREMVQKDGVVVYLDRIESDFAHESENSISIDKCDFVIPCKDKSLEDTCLAVLKALHDNNIIPQAGAKV